MVTFLVIIFIIFLLGLVGFLYAKAYLFKTDGAVIIIHKPDGKTLFSLELNDDPVDFHQKHLLIFKVVEERDES